MDHAHQWESAAGHFGRYVCACGASGYRAAYGENRNKIVPHKVRQKFTRDPKVHVGNPNMGQGNAHRGRSGPGGW